MGLMLSLSWPDRCCESRALLLMYVLPSCVQPASWLGVDEVSSGGKLMHLARDMTEQYRTLKHLIFFIRVRLSQDFPFKPAETRLGYG